MSVVRDNACLVLFVFVMNESCGRRRRCSICDYARTMSARYSVINAALTDIVPSRLRPTTRRNKRPHPRCAVTPGEIQGGGGAARSTGGLDGTKRRPLLRRRCRDHGENCRRRRPHYRRYNRVLWSYDVINASGAAGCHWSRRWTTAEVGVSATVDDLNIAVTSHNDVHDVESWRHYFSAIYLFRQYAQIYI